MRLWKLLVDEHALLQPVYRKLGVLLTNDDLVGESMYNDLLPEVVERLAHRRAARSESDGAEVVFPPGFTNREGEPLPLIVQKRGGGFNYAHQRPRVRARPRRAGQGDLLLYVVGAPQAQHLAMVFDGRANGRLAAHRRPGQCTSRSATCSASDRKMFKSRSGEPVRFVDAARRSHRAGDGLGAREEPRPVADEQIEIGRMVGIGAVKYADLSTDRIKDYVFDWDRMLSFDGNTAPYLQYAHARICSRSSARRGDGDRRDAARAHAGRAAGERDLIAAPPAVRRAVHDTLEKYSPHRLCTYLFDLAQAFTVVLRGVPGAEGRPRRPRASGSRCATSRLGCLPRGSALLGIEAPERM